MLTSDEADELAKSLRRPSRRTRYLEAEGRASGNPRIQAGTKVKIDGVGTSFGGTYGLVVHAPLFRGRRRATRRIFTISGRSPRSLVDLMTPAARRGWGNSVVSGS